MELFKKFLRRFLIACCMISCSNAYSKEYSELRWIFNDIHYTTCAEVQDENEVKEVYVCNTEADDFDPNYPPTSKYSGDILIPSYITISGKLVPVKGIAKYAFYKSNVNTVTLSSSVKFIGEEAFVGCSNLTKIVMPRIEKIGYDAFQRCEKLEEIDIPASVTSIGSDAFAYMTGLKEFKVAEGNLNFCAIDGVLYNYEKTELINFPCAKNSVRLPETLKRIENYSFADSEISFIEFPPSLRYIGFCSFKGTSKLRSIIIPPTVEVVGPYAFLESGIESVEYLSACDNCSCVFYECEKLSSVRLTEGLKKLPYGMFSHCSSLKNIIIPNSVETIGGNVFVGTGGSEGIESITLGNSIKEINRNAFTYTDIHNIYCLTSIPPKFDLSDLAWNDPLREIIFSKNTLHHCNLYVPYVLSYSMAEVWERFHNIKSLDASVEEFGSNAEYSIIGNTIYINVENININIYTIDGVLLFESCSRPTKVELPPGYYILQIGNKSRKVLI